MNPDLTKLIDLQTTDSQIKRIDAALHAIPHSRTELDAALATEAALLNTARERLAAAQKRRRENEGALQDLEIRRSRYKSQLMEVKTNKEYQAMLHEIEGVEREIRSIEDRILEDMEAAEGLSTALIHEQQTLAEAEIRHKQTVGELEAQSRALEEERQRWQRERDALAATLPTELLERYERVAHLRGIAVAEARDGACQQCRMLLRPQMYVELKRNDQVVQCPSCSRVLYYVPPPPTVDLSP
jgi:uncharacterized protein